MLSSLAATSAAQSARDMFLRAVTVGARGNDSVIALVADTPLPEPIVGTLEGPPRIFLDFTNVRPRVPATTRSPDPRVQRVRVALHSAQPTVTRVVIDLASLQPYRLEREGNQLRVVLGIAAPPPAPPAPLPVSTASSPAPIPRVPSLPEPPIGKPPVADKPLPVAPHRTYTPSPSIPLKDLERYRQQVSGPLDRLRMQEPLLKSLDGNEDQPAERVQMAIDEFERLKQEFSAVKPPDTLRVQHGMLLQSSTLAVMAATLRLEWMRTGDATTKRNASSAAAGAILLLDRACGELGCSVP
jgi:AMIN domain